MMLELEGVVGTIAVAISIISIVLLNVLEEKHHDRSTRLTTSKPLPLSILSVVATTFPPFLCKSHMILRLETCGNICWIRSTSASLARKLFAALRPCDPECVLEEKKK